jgi:hypothetical protein
MEPREASLMALAPFFERAAVSIGRHLSAAPESLERVVGDAGVSVICGPDVEESRNSQWTSELLVNLLARLYPRLEIVGPVAWARRLNELAHAINPSIKLTDSSPAATVAVAVGAVDPAAAPSSAIWTRADGWVARLHGAPIENPAGPPNPFSAGASACFAARRVFNRVFAASLSRTFDEPDLDLSLLDFGQTSGADQVLTPCDLGPLGVIGLGAVGNALLWSLGRHPALEGKLWLVDHEKHELSNLQRYVLAMYRDRDRAKTTVCEEALSSTKLRLELRRQRFEEFAEASLKGSEIPTLCVSVDNVPTRRAAQAVLPRLLLNGWTGDRSLGVSWHRFEPDVACLACLYHPRGRASSQTELAASALGIDLNRVNELWIKRLPLTDDDLRAVVSARGVPFERVRQYRGKTIDVMYREAVCGAAALPMPNGHEEAVPLAHQSALAGVLLGAEVVKRLDPSLMQLAQSETLAVWNDLFRPPPRSWLQRCAAEAGCICTDADYRTVFAEKWRQQT